MIKRNAIFDVIIIGAGASGLMCGISASKRGRKVLILDHNDKPGKKILISGGGKCNFTNYDIQPENYISHNPHFVKSALSRYNQWNFLDLVNQYKVPYEERTNGQLFCKQSSKDILKILLSECKKNNVQLMTNCSIKNILKKDTFEIETEKSQITSQSLVIATGGLSYQSAGASNFGYNIARQFGLEVLPTSPGLTPLLYSKKQQKSWSDLSGISLETQINYKNYSFQDDLLFTHKGISGPVVLQISNYWKNGDRIFINFLPKINLLKQLIMSKSKQTLKNFMKDFLAERLVKILMESPIENKPINQYNEKELEKLSNLFHRFPLAPNAKENLNKAEVTLGGIDTNELSSKTFESQKVKGLYFTGEVLDVTGWLGGYNLQWAWSSGWCAGLYV